MIPTVLLLLLAQPPNGVKFEQHLDAQVPLDATFRDAQGETVRLRDCLDGKPAVLALVYYECPMLCTLVLNGLVRSLKACPLEVGKDFRVIAISIDPGETPALAREKKSSYAKLYGGGSEAGWRFLTGEEDQIRRVADAVGYCYRYVAERDEYAHPAGLVILTPGGRAARYLYGVEYPSRDLRLALVEASKGEIGTAVDELLLVCFHYDPATGRYGFAIITALRVGGALTVLVLAWLIWRLARRRRPTESAA
jgi:protein SCO1/2